MNTSALITMVATWAIVIGLTGYFFIKVLIGNKPSADDDSASAGEIQE